MEAKNNIITIRLVFGVRRASGSLASATGLRARLVSLESAVAGTSSELVLASIIGPRPSYYYDLVCAAGADAIRSLLILGDGDTVIR